MLTITDLSTESNLDTAAMSGVRGGSAIAGGDFTSFFGYFNAPTIDLGTHELIQSQGVAVDQSGTIGGVNASHNYQMQNGVSGQVSGF